jgi:2-C-methyl-D-erythritol 4-phosphate cytidylyltransferase
LKKVEVRLGVVRVGRPGTVWVIVEDGSRVMVPVTVIVAVGDTASDAAGVEEAVPMGIAVKVCGWKGVRLGMGELVIVEVLVEVGGST